MSDLSKIPTDVLAAELEVRRKAARRLELARRLPSEVTYRGKLLDFSLEVFLVRPSVHGNGGWCGSKTITKEALRDLLCKDPQQDHGYNDGTFGDDRYRICIDEDPNNSIAIYDDEDWKWKLTDK